MKSLKEGLLSKKNINDIDKYSDLYVLLIPFDLDTDTKSFKNQKDVKPINVYVYIGYILSMKLLRKKIDDNLYKWNPNGDDVIFLIRKTQDLDKIVKEIENAEILRYTNFSEYEISNVEESHFVSLKNMNKELKKYL